MCKKHLLPVTYLSGPGKKRLQLVMTRVVQHHQGASPAANQEGSQLDPCRAALHHTQSATRARAREAKEAREGESEQAGLATRPGPQPGALQGQ